MKKLNSIFFLLLVCNLLSGQLADSVSSEKKGNYKDLLNLEPIATSQSIMYKKFNYNTVYQQTLGVFCKIENKASKNAPVQLRMRLGSLEYVDRLEQKHNPAILSK